MKKSYLKYIIITFIIFLFNSSNVSALRCEYGQIDKNNKFVKALTLDYDTKYIIDLAASPILKKTYKINGEDKEPVLKIHYFEDKSNKDDDNNGVTDYFVGVSSGWNYEIYFNAPKLSDKCTPNVVLMKKNDNVAIVDESDSSARQIAFKFLDRDENDESDKIDCDLGDYCLVINPADKDNTIIDDEYNCPSYKDGIDNIKSAIKNKSCENNPEFDETYKDLSDRCDLYLSSGSYIDRTDSNNRINPCLKACTNLNDEIDSMCSTKNEKNYYCGTFGNDMINWIIKIFKYVRYGLPAILIILSVMDFIKAITQEDDSKMKEAQKRFIHRLIAIALLFVIPFLLNFVLRIFNIPGLDAKNPFCIF